MLTKDQAAYAVEELEKAIVNKLASKLRNGNDAMAHAVYVERLKREMIEMLTGK